jgi:tetratricopeptide (TPR) repeat protein
VNIRNFFYTTILVALTVVAVNAQTSESKSILKRGDALVAQEKYKLAIEEYLKVSSRDADSYARAIYNIGVCHYELWQTDEAIEFYKRAIELKQGNYPRASYALGVALEDQGKTTEAKIAYEQAVNASQREFCTRHLPAWFNGSAGRRAQESRCSVSRSSRTRRRACSRES